MFRVFELTPQEVDALTSALELAAGDQEHYLQCGSPQFDYGSEWPDVARSKSQVCHHWAEIAEKLGVGGSVYRELAKRFEKSATG